MRPKVAGAQIPCFSRRYLRSQSSFSFAHRSISTKLSEPTSTAFTTATSNQRTAIAVTQSWTRLLMPRLILLAPAARCSLQTRRDSSASDHLFHWKNTFGNPPTGLLRSLSGIHTIAAPFDAYYLRWRTISSTVSTGSGFESVNEGPSVVRSSTKSSDCLALMRYRITVKAALPQGRLAMERS